MSFDSRTSFAAAQADLLAPRPEPLRGGEAPNEESMTLILEAATRVPDHGGLRPWRFAVIRGTGRDTFGEALVAGLHEIRGNDVPPAAVQKMRQKAYAAPCAVMLIASPHAESNVPLWEQVASASCTGYAMVLAATSLGFGAVWKSAPVLDTAAVKDVFKLGEREQLLGWVNLGSAGEVSRKKEQPTDEDLLAALVSYVGAPES
jgi:nitroreductase